MFSIDMSAIFLTLCFKAHTREFLKSNFDALDFLENKIQWKFTN